MSGYGFSSTTYDDEDRLTAWNRADNALTKSWNLSAVGDWNSVTENSSTQSRTHGPTHELLTAAGQNVTTDTKGNMTVIPAVLRPGADPLNLTWDMDNRLSSADVDNDSVADVSYQFDALGRRVARDDGTTTTIYVQSGQQTIADYVSGAAATSPTYTYYYASYIDEPIYRTGTGSSRYYHRTQQYSITALTDTNANVTERYAYTAYGTPTITDGAGSVLTTSADNNRFMYTGREWDEALSLYHFRARMYDSYSGRFLSHDPICEIRAIENLYLFLGASVFNFVDPSGLFSVENVINLLNQDPETEWVTCCLANRSIRAFDRKIIKKRNSVTGEIRTYIGGGQYNPRGGEIQIDFSKSDVEAASTLIQECMHARDQEYPDFGEDPLNDREDALDWRFRREVAGRIFEEEWRIRNGLPPKSGLDGTPIYPNDGRSCSGGTCVVDSEAIKDYVILNYPHLLSENQAPGGGSVWETISVDYTNEQILPKSQFEDACKCSTSGNPFQPLPFPLNILEDPLNPRIPKPGFRF